jgi:hypothetical protein
MFGHDDSNNSHHSDPIMGTGVNGSDAAAISSVVNKPAAVTDGTPPVGDDTIDLLNEVSTANINSNGGTSHNNHKMNPSDDELLNIKQQALQQLSPLVGHLDQSPEERFRTTMMLIQAADNKSLLKDAYEAAQGITDEKVRAQALLDVVNEINYFTQQENEDKAA